jgi:hypothetical protein
MVPIATQSDLLDALAPLLAEGLVVRLDPQPGSRAENYAQTIAPGAHPVPARTAVQPAPPRYAPGPAVPPPAPVADLAPIDKRIRDLQDDVQTLRRQLSNLAWKLGEKLDPP